MFKKLFNKVRAGGLEEAVKLGLITEEEKLKIEVERSTRKLLDFVKKNSPKEKKRK